MPDGIALWSVAEHRAPRSAAPQALAMAGARLSGRDEAFDSPSPVVPDHIFIDEPMRALYPGARTGLHRCDISWALSARHPATTPHTLARYARIRRGETLTLDLAASVTIVFTIRGGGTTQCGTERVAWEAGDLFTLAGGLPAIHAAHADSVLWIVSDEAPQASCRQKTTRTILPSLIAAMHSLPPGATLKPHRRDTAMVALIIEGEGCYSVIGGKRRHWTRWATMIIPPGSTPSHHNEGDKHGLLLIAQDGGSPITHARRDLPSLNGPAEHPSPVAG